MAERPRSTRTAILGLAVAAAVGGATIFKTLTETRIIVPPPDVNVPTTTPVRVAGTPTPSNTPPTVAQDVPDWVVVLRKDMIDQVATADDLLAGSQEVRLCTGALLRIENPLGKTVTLMETEYATDNSEDIGVLKPGEGTSFNVSDEPATWVLTDTGNTHAYFVYRTIKCTGSKELSK